MKSRIARIILSAAVLSAAVLIKADAAYVNIILFIAAYIIIGADVLYRAVVNIFHGQLFDENFLMCLATVGAFAIGEYPEAVAVMLFYQVGESFQSYAVNKSRRSIASLMDIRPDYANLIKDEEILKVSPEEVKPSDSILIKPGERVPLDGTVTQGHSSLDTSALTGESLPHEVFEGDDVLSGCINLSGVLTVRVSKAYGESTVSKVLDLVENASNKKSSSENFITRFARVYTPIVVAAAVLLAVLPPLLIKGQLFLEWLYRALTFLVVSCPCALVISVPLSFFGGIGGASRSGVLVKGGNYLEALAKVKTVVFDKTGTLTKGVFEVSEVNAADISENELLEIAAYTESFSPHPISRSLIAAYGKPIDASLVTDAEEIAGYGVSAVYAGKKIYAGNMKLMQRAGVKAAESSSHGTVVYVAREGEYLGSIIISDKLKDDSAKAVGLLKSEGVRRTVMLTGDNEAAASSVAEALSIDEYHAGLLPADKVKILENILKENRGGKVAFVGDGINDAPVLALADVGIAMGGLGSDAAIEAADVVIMTDEPSKIAAAMKTAKRTLSIANQNIVFALAVKTGVLILSAFGIATMWEAVFAEVGVAVIAIINALRALKAVKQS